MKLGVNIDHVATVREARKTFEPDPVKAALECEKAGCDGIVCHLRKDRRHINDKDLENLKNEVVTKLNLEMSVDPEIVDIACKTKPDQATIVPENRQEITTEGGLDVVGNFDRIKEVVNRLVDVGIDVSLFIDPEEKQIDASKDVGATIVEFHTGCYAEDFNAGRDHKKEIEKLRLMTEYGKKEGIIVCAGHGLTYQNIAHIVKLEGIEELNIGHSIISRAVVVGIHNAVLEMTNLIQ